MKPVEETARRLTPLHLAAAANWPEAVKLLLNNRAGRYAQDSELCLPIDFAIQSGCLEAVKLLLDGDCILHFTAPRQHKLFKLPQRILYAIFMTDGNMNDILLRALISLHHSSEALRLYHAFPLWVRGEVCSISAAERLFSGGFIDLELRDEFGKTALMQACQHGHLQYCRFLLEKGANASTPHRDSAITAGFFLAAGIGLRRSETVDLKLCARILQPAFDLADTVESHCMCSPGGFTPVTALSRSFHSNERRWFRTLILCLHWPLYIVEQQTRAFALGEVFDRLQMTHTCVDICKPGQQISEDDRLAIESDEDEFHYQLQQFMEEYDLGRTGFASGPLEYLDWFFETHELDLPSFDPNTTYSGRSSYDSNLLGPGLNYQSARRSFSGKMIYYGHKELVTEENVLALLFDKDHCYV
jgi:hypothetical protein